jgi:hypothetical protein
LYGGGFNILIKNGWHFLYDIQIMEDIESVDFGSKQHPTFLRIVFFVGKEFHFV